MRKSPYLNTEAHQWPRVTEALIGKFPLGPDDIVGSVNRSWEELYRCKIGRDGLQFGKDIFLPAQATGVILEKLIARDLAKKHAGWRGGRTKIEKDVVFEPDDAYSFEIKTSSSAKGIYGNRSTGNRAENSQKRRTGYYLVINYKLPTEENPGRSLNLIRFGWIDDDDWVGQASASGQQASVNKQVATGKLIVLSSR